MWGLAAAQYGSLGPKLTPTLEARLGYQSLVPHTSDSQNDSFLSSSVFIDKISIADINGNR
jgi:hypothetical protein